MPVSVHHIIPAADGGDLTHADFLHLFLEGLHIGKAGRGGHIPSVQEAVDIDLLHLLTLAQFQQSIQVGDVAVNAAVGQKTHQVHAAPLLLGLLASAHQFCILKKGAVLDLLCDPGQLLIDHASCADVGVAHFAVAHLAIGQAHIQTGAANGQINWENLEKLERAVGKEHLVLDLSCRKKDGQYYIVTDRWQNFTQVPVSEQTIAEFSSHCDEFLVHAVDVEGKASGIEVELVKLLAKKHPLPVTYAGGVGSFEDLELLKKLGNNHVDVTIGSALDIFGGTIPFEKAADIS